MKGYCVLLLVFMAAASGLFVPHGRDEEQRWRSAGHIDISKFIPERLILSTNETQTGDSNWRDTFVFKKGTKDFSEVCGIENRDIAKEDRIIGGKEAEPNQYPWQVALFTDDKYFCGGTLIGDQWVLTAGHCAAHSKFQVIAGAHNWQNTAEPHRQDIISYEAYIHPGYSRTINDLALVKLPEPVTFNKWIKPACLPSAGDDIVAGDKATVTGWGDTGSSAISDVLMVLHGVNIVSWEDCMHGPTVVCASTYGMGTCFGDSGGPLTKADGFRTSTPGQRWVQHGIVSFGTHIFCGYGMNGYTRVSAFTDWIETVTGIIIN